jgi:hypothetical protein
MMDKGRGMRMRNGRVSGYQESHRDTFIWFYDEVSGEGIRSSGVRKNPGIRASGILPAGIPMR